MTELKPCPFCGKQPKKFIRTDAIETTLFISCMNPKCHSTVETWAVATEKKAIRIWNRRVKE